MEIVSEENVSYRKPQKMENGLFHFPWNTTNQGAPLNLF